MTRMIRSAALALALVVACVANGGAQGRLAGSPYSAAMYVVGNPNGRINATRGTIAADTSTSTLYVNTNGRSAWSSFSSLFSGTFTGSGTTNRITKFTGATALGNANASDSGTLFAILESATVAAGANTAGLAVSSTQTNQTSNVPVVSIDGSSATWSVTGGSRVATGLDVNMRTSCTSGQCTPNGLTAVGISVKADASGYALNSRCAIAVGTTSGPTCPTTGDYGVYIERGDLWVVNGAIKYGPGGTPLTTLTNSAGANVIMKSDGTNAVASSATDDGTTFSVGGGGFAVNESNGAVTSLSGIASTGLLSGFSSGSYHWAVDTAGNTNTSGAFTGTGVTVATASVQNFIYRATTGVAPTWSCASGTGATIDSKSANWMAKVHSSSSSSVCTLTFNASLANATSALCVAIDAGGSGTVPAFASSYTANTAAWNAGLLTVGRDFLVQCTFIN